ncbi:ankyrin repeat-containing domain protein [Trichoderma camerunense]
MAELDPRAYTVAWIAPLEIEAQAALHMLDNRHSGKFPLTPGDDYVFQAGDACGHNIIIATLPAGEVYGTRSAAALATQIKKFFPKLWFGLLVGIAAGLPNLSRNPPVDIRLGDILVGLSVGDNAGLIDYDLGKETGADGFQLLRAGHALAKTATVVRSAISSIKLVPLNDSSKVMQHYKRIEHKAHFLGTFADPGQGRDVLYQVSESGIESPLVREPRPASKRIRVWYGSIGSGDKLMKNAQRRNELRDKYNIIGLEMEAAGTMDQIPVGVIRGVCDYGDEHKNDEWQPYAAAMAAAYARAILEEIRPENVAQIHSVDVSPKRKLDEEGSASENEDRKRQCHAEGEYPATEMMGNEVKKSLIEQLYFDKIDERLMNLTAAQGRTCCWFLDKPEYISWNDASQQTDHGGFLWIKGHPGTGKSTLMKFLFEKVKINAKADSLQIILSFFFLARGTVEEKSTMGLYRSLLHQLFEKVPDAQNGLEWMTRDGARVIQRNGWNEKALKQTLAHAVRKLGNKSLTIFVDALDECNKNQVADMVCYFEELCEGAQESPVRLRVCFSSRHYPTITIAKGIEVILEDEIGHTEDIEYYIKSKLRLGQSAQALSLRSEILDRSSNIFLWVVLVLDILNREYPNSIKQMRDRLKEIPPELNDLFEMILTRDGENLEKLHLCLKWILFANRPLKPQELYFAVQLGYDQECSGCWDRNDIELDEIKTFVRSYSKGLAEVTRNKAAEVQFIHESVRDFLLSKYESQWSEASGNFLGNSHNLLRDCCLAQLNRLALQDADIVDPLPPASETAELRQTIRSNYPFLEYSVRNSLQHADSTQQNGIDQGKFFTDFPLQKWILLHNTLEQHQIRRYTNSVSLLYILAERNLVNLIGIHPRRFSFFDIEDGIERYGTPIFAALAINNHEAVNTFLKLLVAILPSTSPLHELCELYRRNPTGSSIFKRDFAFGRKFGIPFYLEEECDETLICAFISLRDLSVGPDARGHILPTHNNGTSGVTGTYKKSLFLWAATNGLKAVVQLLLTGGSVDPNCHDYDGETALSRAAQNNHEAVIQLLFTKSAVDLNRKDRHGQTPLFWAVKKGREAAIQLFLKQAGVDLNCKDNYGQTPLLYAASYGHETVVQLFLTQSGVDLNCKDRDGQTPLFRAVKKGREAVIQLLLTQAGVDLNCKDNYGQTPLLYAASNGHETVVQLFLTQSGVDLNCKDRDGQTPLFRAVKKGHEAIVQLLLTRATELGFEDHDKLVSLIYAACRGHKAIVQVLLTKGADPDYKDDYGRTPLSWAAGNGHKAVVQLLLIKGVDLCCEDKYGRIPLLYAACNGHETVVQLLLTKGADLDYKDNYNRTSLLYAASNGHEAIVQLLLIKGADPDHKDNYGRTSLLYAVRNGHIAIVKLLLTKGADPYYKDNDGRTPLSYVAGNDHTAIVELLSGQDGVNPDCEDGESETLLSRTNTNGHKAAVQQLLAKTGINMHESS